LGDVTKEAVVGVEVGTSHEGFEETTGGSYKWLTNVFFFSAGSFTNDS
jgi:hypothetical protein